MKKLIFILLLFLIIVYSQDKNNEDLWKQFRYFVGKWEGKGNGSPGSSNSLGECKFIFNERYLQFTGKAVFDPQDKNPQSEVHEDMGFISFDKMRKKYIFRQFHIEGFINQYVLDSISGDNKLFIFNTESIENIPPGFRAKITWQILNEDEYSWKFDLAQPGKEFVCYSDNKMERIK